MAELNAQMFDVFNPQNQNNSLPSQQQNLLQKRQNPVSVNDLYQQEKNDIKNEASQGSSDEEFIFEEEHQTTVANPDKYKVEDVDLVIKSDDCGCHHELIIPRGYVRKNKIVEQPAKQYKFVLDPFQKKATECLENNESVLVAAHTSAGKTVVAEYAIAMSFREKSKVVYTSPIKALSNQKYRELNEEFGDVGLVTGDVTINQNASCLVMTTEILRSMLYRGSEIIREVSWVIFDEVHYMRDKERGVIWEETIIMLNPNVRFVFLSATIPNAREFGEWIATIKRQPMNIVYTDYRPTPLQHYIFPSGGEGIYMVVDEKGQFREDNFNKAVGILGEGLDLTGGVANQKKKKPTEGADLFKILKMIMEKKFSPVIIFSFSKKEVEGYAMAMLKFDLTTEDEKDKIGTIFESAIDCLSEEDRNLPQIQQMLPILKKGIGLHHGGLLPIVKETIEILFQEGFLKALFSTETFSMGLNMPAKTVVFTSVRKFDGENFRWIAGGEYIQMSGRAGRRGIDDRGITILMIDEKMEPDIAKGMLKGQSDPLNSSFHLSYNMLLNCMRIEDTDPDYIIRRSLHQFQSNKAIPEMKQKLLSLTDDMNSIQLSNENSVQQIYDIDQQQRIYKDKIQKIICQPEIILPFLSIGRLVYIKKGDQNWGWGVSVNFNKKKVNMRKQKKNSNEPEQLYVVDVMIHIQPRQKNEEPQPISVENDGIMEVIPMMLENIYEVSSVRIMLPDDLTLKSNKIVVKETMKEINKQFKDNLPLLNPLKDMKIDSDDLDKLISKRDALNKERDAIVNSLGFNVQDALSLYDKKQKYKKSIGVLKSQLEDSNKMVLQDDLACMKRVLRRLGHINKDDIVQTKGKVACEISASDEIIVTELMFAGIFSELASNEIAALLSCLVHDENSKEAEKAGVKHEKLSKYFGILLEHAKKVHKVFVESKINLDEQEYLQGFKPQLVDLTLAWCNGASFAEICKMTDAYEGSIIRCLRRLDELLKQLMDASKSIGNTELEMKFKEASSLLKRGIVFAASLYVGF